MSPILPAVRSASMRHDIRALIPAALAMTIAATIASINPVGYIGGGSDDWQYLEAARCVAREGFCVPRSHWAARLPLILPTGAVLAGLGETRAHIMLVPIAYGLAAILLFVAVVQRAAGRTAAALAGAALATSPMIAGEITALNVSSVEFFWAIAAVFAWGRALDTQVRRWAGLAGAMLAFALISRATAFALIPIAALGLLFLRRGDRPLVAFAALGLAAVLLTEAGVYAVLAGDPLHAWSLALTANTLPSSETTVVSGSPLFNQALVAGWERTQGIHVHWMIDGALNLLADPTMAPTLWAALVLLFLARGPKIPLLLLGAACLYFGALTYGLAIDPKPRMFLPVAAAACAIFGMCGSRLWHEGGRPLIVAMLGLLASNAAAIAYNKLDLRDLERTAAAWAAPGMAIDETARRVLTLVPRVRALPGLPSLPAPATRLLTVSAGACTAGPSWTLARSRRFGMTDPAPLATLRARGIGLGPVQPLALCEFSRDRAEALQP